MTEHEGSKYILLSLQNNKTACIHMPLRETESLHTGREVSEWLHPLDPKV